MGRRRDDRIKPYFAISNEPAKSKKDGAWWGSPSDFPFFLLAQRIHRSNHRTNSGTVDHLPPPVDWIAERSERTLGTPHHHQHLEKVPGTAERPTEREHMAARLGGQALRYQRLPSQSSFKRIVDLEHGNMNVKARKP